MKLKNNQIEVLRFRAKLIAAQFKDSEITRAQALNYFKTLLRYEVNKNKELLFDKNINNYFLDLIK